MAKKPHRRADKKRRSPHLTAPTASSKVIWVGQLARRWSISPVTLWRYRQEGKVPAADFSIGDRAGWRLETIEQFEQRAAPPPPPPPAPQPPPSRRTVAAAAP